MKPGSKLSIRIPPSLAAPLALAVAISVWPGPLARAATFGDLAAMENGPPPRGYYSGNTYAPENCVCAPRNPGFYAGGSQYGAPSPYAAGPGYGAVSPYGGGSTYAAPSPYASGPTYGAVSPYVARPGYGAVSPYAGAPGGFVPTPFVGAAGRAPGAPLTGGPEGAPPEPLSAPGSAFLPSVWNSPKPYLPYGPYADLPNGRLLVWTFGQVNSTTDPFNTTGLSTPFMFVPWSTPLSGWTNAQTWNWWRERAGVQPPYW